MEQMFGDIRAIFAHIKKLQKTARSGQPRLEAAKAERDKLRRLFLAKIDGRQG